MRSHVDRPFPSTALALAGLVGLSGCGSAAGWSPQAEQREPQAPTTAGQTTAGQQSATSASAAQPLSEAQLVERGRVLVQMGGCTDCHTPMQFDEALGMPVPDRSRYLSGHPEGGPDPTSRPGQGDQGVIGATFTSFRLPFGVVYAANITPDPETGLGAWTREEFVQTMRKGHRRGTGRVILPPMPWQNLQNQTTEDLQAVHAFLRTVAPIKNRVPDPKVPQAVIDGMAATYARMASASPPSETGATDQRAL